MKNFIIILVLTTFLGCIKKDITSTDIVGAWTNIEIGTIEFEKDGGFKVKNLLAKHLIPFSERLNTNIIDAIGEWKIINSNTSWAIEIHFNNLKEFPNGVSTVLLVGWEGITENGKLYLYCINENGPPYKFYKQ